MLIRRTEFCVTLAALFRPARRLVPVSCPKPRMNHRLTVINTKAVKEPFCSTAEGSNKEMRLARHLIENFFAKRSSGKFRRTTKRPSSGSYPSSISRRERLRRDEDGIFVGGDLARARRIPSDSLQRIPSVPDAPSSANMLSAEAKSRQFLFQSTAYSIFVARSLNC